jgi:hypothetical protein
MGVDESGAIVFLESRMDVSDGCASLGRGSEWARS